MRIFFKISFLSCFLLNTLLIEQGYAAVTQILNDNFYPNPAELQSIKQSKIILGSIFINPYVHYTGTANDSYGETESDVRDSLPYLLVGYRLNEQWTLGFNAIPTSYAHISWSKPSFIAEQSTETKELYYRFGIQSGYRYNEKLSLGAGFNVEDNTNYCINFVVPGQGNQENCIHDVNYTGNVGLYYKLNDKNFISLSANSQVNTYGHGSSVTDSSINNQLSFNITQAPVLYIGGEHFVTEQWYIEEKIYWSGWSIQKNLNFTNTTTGSYIVPTNLKDVWSFQITTRYALKPYLALLASAIYETNSVPLATNAIGYPLAASDAFSGGLDISYSKDLSFQCVYTYGSFTPNSPIDNATNKGIVNAHINATTLQMTYKT